MTRSLYSEGTLDTTSDVSLKQQSRLPRKVVTCAVLVAVFFIGSATFFTLAFTKQNAPAADERKPGSMSQREVANWLALKDRLVQEISPVDPLIARKLSEPSTSEWQAMQWLFTIDQTNTPQEYTIQRFALVATFIHFSLAVDATLHECDWGGVECAGATGQPYALNALNFSKYNLAAGTIPITLAYVSPSLESLDLSAQGLKGTIPSACFIRWTKLVTLDLNDNKLTRFFSGVSGDVVALKALETLTIANNRLDETVSKSIESWTSLKYLDMRGNAELTGPLLEYVLPHWKTIKHIEISHTRIDGTIPYDVTLPYLTTLVGSNTQLSGVLPESLATATNLRTLELGVSVASKPWIGTLPSSYASLTAIETFALVNLAQITGTLPSEWGEAWKRVRALNLYGNHLLTGTIPNWSGMTDLAVLRLGETGISGSIPSSLGELEKLSYLGLAQTNLTGTMPPEVCNLRVRHVLNDLEADCFVRSEGEIPHVVCLTPECCTLCTSASD